MVGGNILHLAALLLAALLLSASPVMAHKQERQDKSAPATAARPQAGRAAPGSAASGIAQQDHMTAMMEEQKEDRSTMSTGQRLLDWLGRLHPIIIHFPLAFFPAALLTALVGSRRPAFAKPVQFLVVVGGISAPIAAVLGWFTGGLTLSDTDPLLRVHRWLGTSIGLAGLALAVWAWKRPWEDRRPGMVWALGAITAAIVVQGWYGGAIVHGIDHMDW